MNDTSNRKPGRISLPSRSASQPAGSQASARPPLRGAPPGRSGPPRRDDRRDERRDDRYGDGRPPQRDAYPRDGYGRDGYSRDGYNRDSYGRDGSGRDNYGRDGYNRDVYGRDAFGRDVRSRDEGLGREGFIRDGAGRSGFGGPPRAGMRADRDARGWEPRERGAGPSSAYRAPPPLAPAPQPDAHDGMVRISKLMAEQGLCSRREADAYIERGWVYVDGVQVTELGTRAHRHQTITLSQQARSDQLDRVTILIHKPIGYVSGQAEDGYEPAVVLVKPEHRWADDGAKRDFSRAHLRGLAPAGRLDIDSTGLLVLTQDGRIARHLIGEDSKVEKEYLVRVEGQLSDEGMALLKHGLVLDGVALKPAKVSWQNEDQLRIVLHEGRKRQIRRMCELVGLQVVGLKRVRIGSIVLGKLPLGQWRYLQPHERF